ncbi:MAG: sulfur carrier protein ThiS [Planctomycetota bacterium]|jgi:thiamine biosynthesis protein ThiS
MVVLKVNGVEKEFATGEFPKTVAELLEQMNINAVTVAAEIDGEIIGHEKFGKTHLAEGQEIELVRFVQGG